MKLLGIWDFILRLKPLQTNFPDSWQALYMTLVFALIVMLLGSEAGAIPQVSQSPVDPVDDVVFLKDSKIVTCQMI